MLLFQSTQEATEGTLKTKVEAGASGYIVTGGGDQGIFVKQVLKESSAAKLFGLREGATTPSPCPCGPIRIGWGLRGTGHSGLSMAPSPCPCGAIRLGGPGGGQATVDSDESLETA